MMNHALWKLGPTSVSKEIRQRAHQRGYEKGYSPREMAAAIAYGAAGVRAFLALRLQS
jgi:hypothetical protein